MREWGIERVGRNACRVYRGAYPGVTVARTWGETPGEARAHAMLLARACELFEALDRLCCAPRALAGSRSPRPRQARRWALLVRERSLEEIETLVEALAPHYTTVAETEDEAEQ